MYIRQTLPECLKKTYNRDDKIFVHICKERMISKKNGYSSRSRYKSF
jgi:hypothetical protein